MKILLTILFLSLLSSPSWSETMDDLVKRDGLYYKKFSDVPFSGRVIDTHYGLITNGKREGEWTHYTSDGQLLSTGNYKNGKEEGEWDYYHGIGPLSTENAQLSSTGNYKNGKFDGEWVYYYSNGQLSFKGNYKNDKKEGEWVEYEKDGTLDRERSGTFKNGVKISD